MKEEQEAQGYFDALKERMEKQYAVAVAARAQGKDTMQEVECPPTLDLADRTENIIGPKGVARRYRELYAEHKGKHKGNRNRVIFALFREIIEQKLADIPDDEKRLEQAVKTCLVLVTGGVVVAPLDGVPQVKISRNPDGSRYVDIYFAGPIRAAGGTATVFPLILGDYARQLMQLDRFKPTEDEVERYVEEVNVYDEIITRQYKLKDDDVRKIVRGCPVCINGEPTEEREVNANKDLERIPTNRIRGGMCLVISEGVGLKAMKIMSLAKMLGLNWDWLEDIIKIGKSSVEDEKEVRPNYSYLSRIAAGRPILSYPSRYGGLRLRYGRARNTSVMAKGLHPATMLLCDEFIAVGTQTKMERPGKSAEMFPVDTIEGPIVKLRGGEVRKIKSLEEAVQVKGEVEEILFLGDVLITLGDFRKTAHPLMPAGYCEEWWKLELQKRVQEMQAAGKENAPKPSGEKQGFDFENLLSMPQLIDQNTAIELALQLEVPVHPNFTHYYTALSGEEACEVVAAVRGGEKSFAGSEMEVLEIQNTQRMKELLERIGLPHKAREGKIVIGREYAYSFFKTFGGTSVQEPTKGLPVLEMLSRISGIRIRDKAGTFIGCRMGRPEAAKPRKMVGDPMVLFPIGNMGGNIRSVNKAAEAGEVEVELAYFMNPESGKVEDYPYSHETGARNALARKCEKCRKYSELEKCDRCGGETKAFLKRKIGLRQILEQSAKSLKVPVPKLVKGVKGLINAGKVPEPLEKGLLRARQGLHIFRDGTIRFELLNAPLTHFKPREIGLSVERARELGYTRDHEGRELVSDEQLCELFVQDMVVNREAGEFFVRVTKFIDEELEKFYGMERHYNYDTKEQLVGELFLGLAPHTSAGVLCRIIGYTDAKLNFAHPYFHLAKRRNCFPGETQVLIEEGGMTKLVPIGAFDNGENKEIIKLEGVSTYTVLENGELKKEKVKALFKQKSPEKLRVLRTWTGREITATPDHKMLVFDGKKIVKKEVRSLELADHFISLRKFDAKRRLKEINTLKWYMENSPADVKRKLRVHGIKNIIKKLVEKNGGCWAVAKKINVQRKFTSDSKKGKWIHTALDFDSIPLDMFEELMKVYKVKIPFSQAKIGYNKQRSTIPAVIPVGKELGELVGYFLADGWARTTYGAGSQKFVYQVSFISTENSITRKLGTIMASLFGAKATVEKRNENDSTITLSGRTYYDFFTKILGTGTSAKNKRLPQIFFHSPVEAARGMLAGYVVGDGHITQNSIKITSVNKEMVNEFAFLCTSLGLYPHMLRENREINTDLVHDFYAKKGKTIQIKAWGFRLYSHDLLQAGEWLFGKKKKIFERIKRTIKVRGKRTKNVGSFVLDKIKSMEEILSKEEYVYDLMVEGNKTFIAGFGNLGVYDCDGDQDSIMLVMDALLNFSRLYLPSTRGGRMDAPLVFTVAINPEEIDDEVYEVETCTEYPLELYERSLLYAEPDSVAVPIVEEKIGKPGQYTGFGFTHATTTFDAGPKESRYISFRSMEDKMRAQAAVQAKIRAVDEKDALERVMMSHFMPDIIGNTRAFSRQSFRCSACNAKYRRVPLAGKCLECGAESIILTIAQGSVRKYLAIAKDMIRAHGLSDYLRQRIVLIEKEIDSVFTNEKEQQKSLADYA